MNRFLVPVAVAFWVGATMALGQVRWFARRPLVERLRPYEPGGLAPRTGRAPMWSASTFAEVVGPITRALGDRIVAAFGVRESVAARLHRLHSPLSPTEFRMRQLSAAGISLVVAAAGCIVVGPPAALVVLAIIGLPVLVILLIEQRLISADEARRQRLVLELPVLAEQLGMLLSVGYSMGSALSRLAERGRGATGADLRRVTARMRQGVPATAAMREWADDCGVDAVGRLVSVLAMNEHAGDLGRLVSGEARGIRRDVHRQRIEMIERRAQQVWIPVTVAALVPGAIFIAIPFVEALRAFGGA